MLRTPMNLKILPVLLILAGCVAAPDVALIAGRTRVIAHRGGTGSDGTIAGCLRTLRMGVVFLELDVRLTKDGHAVILHDPTVDRTTDGKGPVDQMTVEALKRLDAGVRFDAACAGERVQTVAEMLRAVGARGIVLLELKVGAAAGPVIDAIRSEGAFDRSVVRTAEPKLLEWIRAAEPRVLLGTMGALPAEAGMEAFVETLKALGVSAITPSQDAQVTRAAVARLQSAGIALWGTNTNDPAVMRRLIEAGADGIITDKPDLLQSLLREEPSKRP